nr:MAG TPA: hypothetical protein [Crassvirales sp.]
MFFRNISRNRFARYFTFYIKISYRNRYYISLIECRYIVYISPNFSKVRLIRITIFIICSTCIICIWIIIYTIFKICGRFSKIMFP